MGCKNPNILWTSYLYAPKEDEEAEADSAGKKQQLDLSLLVSLLCPFLFPTAPFLPSFPLSLLSPPIHLTRPRSQFLGSTLIAFLQRKEKENSLVYLEGVSDRGKVRKNSVQKSCSLPLPTIRDRQTRLRRQSMTERGRERWERGGKARKRRP